MVYKQYLEKIATKLTSEYDTEKEIELIKQYQMNPSNSMLLKKLEKMFRGTITSALQKSQTTGLPPGSLYLKALAYFQKALLAYTPDKGSQPKSWITTTIIWDMGEESRKYRNSSRMSDALVSISQDKYNAETKLNLLNEPVTYGNIQQTINSMKAKNVKTPSLDQLKRIDDLTRIDLSSGVAYGGEDGENLTFEDVFNNTQETTKDILQAQATNDKLHRCLDQLTPQERNVIKDRIGGFGQSSPLGKKNEMRWELVALNNNLRSDHMAKKVYENAMSKLTKMMMEL